MMPRFPHMGYSYPYPSKPFLPSSSHSKKETCPQNPPEKKEEEKESRKKGQDCLFEVLGIKLYFDDILLVCLIFFLYSEGVKDEGLFLALVLLLLS